MLKFPRANTTYSELHLNGYSYYLPNYARWRWCRPRKTPFRHKFYLPIMCNRYVYHVVEPMARVTSVIPDYWHGPYFFNNPIGHSKTNATLLIFWSINARHYYKNLVSYDLSRGLNDYYLPSALILFLW